MRQVFSGAGIFDGERMHSESVLLVDDGRIAGIGPMDAAPDGERVTLDGGVLCPGLVDLQVNGGGGLMLDGKTDLAGLATICSAHAGLGATSLLPTLITDTPEATAHVISLAIAATGVGMPGFLGLHLEGPHLDPRRKGAHDHRLIRPMLDADCKMLCKAARHLPTLMVTVAPSAVTGQQIAALRSAGVIVSLGHSECTFDEAQLAMEAGANCATHLFNAMSPLGSREPGLVGAVLSGDTAAAGIIADGIHVAPATLRVATSARRTGLFLVSDAMCVAGTSLVEFTLGERVIQRWAGRLTLADGTLAGADLTLPDAIRLMIEAVGLSPERAIAMATSSPADAIARQNDVGYLRRGRPADLVHLDGNWRLSGVWQSGERIGT